MLIDSVHSVPRGLLRRFAHGYILIGPKSCCLRSISLWTTLINIVQYMRICMICTLLQSCTYMIQDVQTMYCFNDLQCTSVHVSSTVKSPMHPYGCFLKWWYPQNTPKWSFLVGKLMVVGYHHFRKPPYAYHRTCIQLLQHDSDDITIPASTSSQHQLDLPVHRSRCDNSLCLVGVHGGHEPRNHALI